jgi:Domain of unknown function (DUF4424)
MRTEKLAISREKITVEYDFADDTDQDITTEVAFPIPAYTFQFDDPGGPRGFNDLEVWVNNGARQVHEGDQSIGQWKRCDQRAKGGRH